MEADGDGGLIRRRTRAGAQDERGGRREVTGKSAARSRRHREHRQQGELDDDGSGPEDLAAGHEANARTAASCVAGP